MKFRNKILVALILLLVFSCSLAVNAGINPTVIINGQERVYNPPVEIEGDRAMLPLRYVIEDDAFGGEVFWDGLLRKVALNCQGKYIELFIDNNKAMVDGQVKYLDAAPYIREGCTYVPLRFLAETMGAKVDWNSTTRAVNIAMGEAVKEDKDEDKVEDKVEVKGEVKPNPDPNPDKAKPSVFAYYYYQSFEELKQNVHLFTDISFRWFETNSKGELFYEYQDNYGEILQYTQQNGVKAYASVMLMDKVALHNLLSNPQNRTRLIGNILEVVKRDKYEGVDIDFEFIDPKDAAYFTLFLKELKTSLGADIPLSVAVFARTGNEKWATPYEYAKIGQIVDKVIVMAYDYCYSTSQPGPVAPLWWVEQVAKYMATNIPKEKVFLGLATYGYDWSSAGGKAKTVTAPRLAELKQKYKLTASFDWPSMSPYYTYYDHFGDYHQIWIENEPSLNEKLKVAETYGLGGVSFWRIGNGFGDLYNLLGKGK